MRHHELKTWPAFFEAVADGRKTFEIRLNDRGFTVGDVLELYEYDPEVPGMAAWTGRVLRMPVTYMTEWEQKPGYVVLGLGPRL